MKSFESKITIHRPVTEVYSFLADINNHKQLMPDNVEDWVSTYDEASFSIKNMAKLSLRVASRVENREIVIIPAAKPPFDLELSWILNGDSLQTEATFVIKADLNMMMKMLASGPLQKLADEETQNLSSLLR